MAMSSSEAPYPPFKLANRVHRIGSDDLSGYIRFEIRGAETKAELLRLLPAGTSLEGGRILDFGCGAGRTLRQFLPEADEGSVEVWGADIDRPSIEWLNANLCPPLNAVACDPAPPLPFESGSFAFAWAISVFTHLPESSAAWLLELHRVLEPGGLLMASYMGEWNSEAIAGEPWDPDRIGMNMLWAGNPWDLGGPMVLMSDWWVSEHWGRAFEIVGRSAWFHNQTWVMLRRRDVELTPEELMAPTDDPREIAALRHNIVQLQREVEEQRATAERVRASYETSSSWRLTAPLRRLRGR